MPDKSYKFNWETPNSVWVEFFGVVTFGDAVSATEELYNDFRSDLVKYAFWDFSAISGFVVSEAEVAEMAAMDAVASHYMKPMRAAFIISDPSLTRLGEQYIAYLHDMGCAWDNKLFCNLNDARQWACGQ